MYWFVNLDERRRGRNYTQADTESSTYVIFWLYKTWGLQIKEKTVVKGQKYLLFLALSISSQDKAWGTKIFPDSIVRSQWSFFLDSDIRMPISFCFCYFFSLATSFVHWNFNKTKFIKFSKSPSEMTFYTKVLYINTKTKSLTIAKTQSGGYFIETPS